MAKTFVFIKGWAIFASLSYLWRMKTYLYTLFTITFLAYLFSTDFGTEAGSEPARSVVEVVTNSVPDHEQQLETISKDLKSSKAVTVRRVASTFSNIFVSRMEKTITKDIHHTYLKRQNTSLRISEGLSVYQSLKFSTILSGAGYYVFSLRKIII